MSHPPTSLTPEETKRFLDSRSPGDYHLLDVREDWEYEEFHLPGAEWAPLGDLPERLEGLEREKPAVLYCAVGMRSAAAASMMAARGFREVHNLAGGIMAWGHEVAVGPREQGLQYLRGDETPLQVLALAYVLEDNLGTLYRARAASASDPDLSDVFLRLSRFEEAHKAKVLQLSSDQDSTLREGEAVRKQLPESTLEGGVPMEDFLKSHGEYFLTLKGTLEAAMMLEAQAMDHYLRLGGKMENPGSKALLRELAQEERNHLRVLAGLMRRAGGGESLSGS